MREKKQRKSDFYVLLLFIYDLMHFYLLYFIMSSFPCFISEHVVFLFLSYCKFSCCLKQRSVESFFHFNAVIIINAAYIYLKPSLHTRAYT